MPCPECERLTAQRERLRYIYALAAANVRPSVGSSAGQYMLLKTLADEAQVDLELAETELQQHLSRHTVLVPN